MSEIVALSFTAPGQVKTRVLNRSIKVILHCLFQPTSISGTAISKLCDFSCPGF